MSRLTMLFAAAPLLRPKKFLTIAAISLFSFPAFAQQANIAGNTTIGGQAIITNSTNSTSPSTGALQVTGGAGIEGNAYIGGTINGTGSGITVTPSGGSVASTLGALAGRTVNVLDYGAKCDGTTDDTAAFNAAIAAVGSAGGGTIVVPIGTCVIAGSLTINANNIHLVGQGTGATILDFTGSGTADGFLIGTNPSSSVCVGSTPPSDCQQDYNISVSNMSIEAPSRSGGYIFDINGLSQGTFSDIEIPSSWDIIKAQFVNTLLFQRILGYTNDTSGIGSNLYQAITTGTSGGWYRSDAITFNDFTVNANHLGASCMNWDGMINTVRMEHVALLDCYIGLAVSNSQNSTSYYPEFLMANDLEIAVLRPG